MFESAKLKLERAEKHVRDLDSAFTAFVNQRPHRPLFKAQRQDENAWRMWIEIIVDRHPPAELALIIGDAIHNFRCVLDHLMWELIGIDGGTQDRYTKIPVGRTRVDFESTARGVITPAQTTKDFLASLAIYPTGKGKTLYAIHSLDNADKHTALMPVLHFSYVDGIMLVDEMTGERRLADPIMVGPAAPAGNIFALEVPKGFNVDADHRAYPTPDIFFPEIDVFPNQPVMAVLAWISKAMEETVDDFEVFALGRL
jgi:hypothetical protein